MKDLIERLEARAEPTRELADRVLEACGWSKRRPTGYTTDFWASPDHQKYTSNRPNPLTSIDAATSLVPEGWFWWLGHLDQIDRQFVATLSERAVVDAPAVRGFSTSAAIALTIAALKALAAQKEGA